MSFKAKVKFDCDSDTCDNCRFKATHCHGKKICGFFDKSLRNSGYDSYRCEECLELERKITEDCDV